jgi:flagella basal body P-ring formation protein FlgA
VESRVISPGNARSSRIPRKVSEKEVAKVSEEEKASKAKEKEKASEKVSEKAGESLSAKEVEKITGRADGITNPLVLDIRECAGIVVKSDTRQGNVTKRSEQSEEEKRHLKSAVPWRSEECGTSVKSSAARAAR